MTENNQTQDTQADLNKSQQPETGEAKTSQTLNQGQPGREEKTFDTDQAELKTKQANPDIEDETVDDDAADTVERDTSSN